MTRLYESPLDEIKGKLIESRGKLPGCRFVNGKWRYTLDEGALFVLLDKCFESYESRCRELSQEVEMYRRQLSGITVSSSKRRR